MQTPATVCATAPSTDRTGPRAPRTPAPAVTAGPREHSAPAGTATTADGWQRPFQARLVAADVLGAAVASALAWAARFGPGLSGVPTSTRAVALALPAIWLTVLGANRAYERRVVGAGAVEFQRVLRAFVVLTALVTFAGYVGLVHIARGWVLLALPSTLLVSGTSRYALRKALHHRRRRYGTAVSGLLAVGEPEAIVAVAQRLRRDPAAGMQVVGACLPIELIDAPGARAVLDAAGVPLCGDLDAVAEAAARCGAQTVAVLAGVARPNRLRWVSAQLEGTDVQLVVSPGLTEVAGRRLHVQPVAGLPLVHVDVPQFSGGARIVKTVVDRVGAAVGLVLLAPVLGLIAALVRLDSRGPALFRQQRVGRDGRTFTLLKFRTMAVDAEDRRAALVDRNDADGVLFKLRDDPRVTRVGRVLRRFSLDELPQLANVLRGDMSLVGPRPPLPDEVSRYGRRTRRRLLVQPGLTGLWQVSGRSDLSWEDSVRLDLRYVENWSLALDAAVLLRTARAVVHGKGAY